MPIVLRPQAIFGCVVGCYPNQIQSLIHSSNTALGRSIASFHLPLAVSQKHNIDMVGILGIRYEGL